MSPLFALGADCSTHTTALVVLDHTGYHAHRLVTHTGQVGARRLNQIRTTVGATLDKWAPDLQVAAVEVPLNHNRSFALESCAAIVLEVIQDRYPHLIVMDPTPGQWQEDVIGTGRLMTTKARSLAHANANGLNTRDDNLSDAYCIAEYARELYIRQVLKESA